MSSENEEKKHNNRKVNPDLDAAPGFDAACGYRVLPKHRWRTPAPVMVHLRAYFGIDLDAAAEADHHVAPRWFDADQNCIGRDWRVGWRHEPAARRGIIRRAFMNPPYGAPGEPKKGPLAGTGAFPGTGRFVRECWRQSNRHGLTVLALVPDATDTVWWRKWAVRADEIWFGGRIRFINPLTGEVGGAPNHGHALVIFRPHVPREGWASGPRPWWNWDPMKPVPLRR